VTLTDRPIRDSEPIVPLLETAESSSIPAWLLRTFN
jgi:hypothetical protein